MKVYSRPRDDSSGDESEPMGTFLSTITMATQNHEQPNTADAEQSMPSLSDDDDDDDGDEANRDRSALMVSMQQHSDLHQHGYCQVDAAKVDVVSMHCLVSGFIRENLPRSSIVEEIVIGIIRFQGPLYDSDEYIQIASGGDEPSYFLTHRINCELSKFAATVIDGNPSAEVVEFKQVPSDALRRVLQWLGHHRGKAPAPLPCPIRSISMADIVADPWDAEWVDSFDKKTVFEIIMAANYMDIQPLLHLCCAKIATMIKTLDQSEIDRIIEDEEQHRREHAQGIEDRMEVDSEEDGHEEDDHERGGDTEHRQ